MSNVQEPRENNHPEDNGTDMEQDPQKIEKDIEVSETDERDHIENPTISSMSKIK